MSSRFKIAICGLFIPLFLFALPVPADDYDILAGAQSSPNSDGLPPQPVKQGNLLNKLFSFVQQDKLSKVREREAAQNATMLPENVNKALADLNNGRASEQQRALLFANNDLINRARLNGVIDDKSYQNVQKDFAGINKWLGEQSAKDAKAEFKVQKRDPNKPYDPGTDSDYITKVSSPEQVRQMQQSYNQRINRWMKKSGVETEPRSDWHNKLDTDFMADPAGVSAKDFKEISHLNNDAYKQREAAHYEALSRMSPSELRAAGYPDGKLPTNISSTYVNKAMEGMSKKKADKIDKALNTQKGRQQLRDDPNARAELHKTQAQQQKYIKRKQEAAERLRAAENLTGIIPQERPEITKADREFTERLAEKHKQQALKAGKSKAAAEKAKNNILKSLGQNKRPEESGMSNLPSQGAKRSPETLAKTQAASAVGEHLGNQASSGYARTLAEYAGTNSSAEQQVQQDIAEASKKFSASEKGTLIEQSAESYQRGMERKLGTSINPETARKIAGEKAENFKRGLAAAIRGETVRPSSGDSDGKSTKPTRVDPDHHTLSDVAVIGENAKVKRLDDRKKPTEEIDEGDLIAKVESAYNTGKKLGNAGLAHLKQQELLEARRKALERNDFNAAIRYQKKAAEYGQQARQHFGEAIVEGLNSESWVDVGNMGETGMGAGIGDAALTAYRAGEEYGKAKLEKMKASEYREKAMQAEKRGEKKIASKYNRLAARAQRQSTEHFNEGMRNTPITGSLFDLSEAAVLKKEAERLRAQATALLEKKNLTQRDLAKAQKLNKQARELENKQYKNVRSAVTRIPVAGQALTRIEGVSEEYGRALSGYQRSNIYWEKAEAARKEYERLKDTDPMKAESFKNLETKYKKLHADSYIKASNEQMKALDNTPIIGAGENFGQTLYESRKAEEHFEAARLARERGDHVSADKHLNQALRHQHTAKEEWDKLSKRAPGEAAMIATLLGTGYAPHIVWGASWFKGTREWLQTNKTGKRFEEAKTDITSVAMGKLDDLANWLQGKETTKDRVSKSIEQHKRVWFERLRLGQVVRYPGMSDTDIGKAIESMVNAGRSASLQNLGDLDPYIYVPQPVQVAQAAEKGTVTSGKTEKKATLSADTTKAGKAETKSSTGDQEPSSSSSDSTPGDDTTTTGLGEPPLTAAGETPPKEERSTGWEETTEGEPDGVIILPDVVGLSLADGISAIKAAGLTALPPELGSSALRPEDAGKIELAVPSVDGELHAGDGVVLQVYGEIVDSGNVPNVIGQDLKKAMDTLEQAGFSVTIELGPETRDIKKDGTVARQSPQAGSLVEAGSDIRLIVFSQAIDTTQVPHLTGLTQKEATYRLGEVGLFINAETDRPAPSRREVGKVYKQYPEPGFEVMNGIGINVWIYGKVAKNTVEAQPASQAGVPYVEIPTHLAGMPLGELDAGSYNIEYPLSRRHFAQSTMRLTRSKSNGEFHFTKWGMNERRVSGEYSDKDHTIAVPTINLRWLEAGDKGSPYQDIYKTGLNLGCWSNRDRGKVMEYNESYGKNRDFVLDSTDSVATVSVQLYQSKFSTPAARSQIHRLLPKLLKQIEPFAKKCSVSNGSMIRTPSNPQFDTGNVPNDFLKGECGPGLLGTVNDC